MHPSSLELSPLHRKDWRLVFRPVLTWHHRSPGAQPVFRRATVASEGIGAMQKKNCGRSVPYPQVILPIYFDDGLFVWRQPHRRRPVAVHIIHVRGAGDQRLLAQKRSKCLSSPAKEVGSLEHLNLNIQQKRTVPEEEPSPSLGCCDCAGHAEGRPYLPAQVRQPNRSRNPPRTRNQYPSWL